MNATCSVRIGKPESDVLRLEKPLIPRPLPTIESWAADILRDLKKAKPGDRVWSRARVVASRLHSAGSKLNRPSGPELDALISCLLAVAGREDPWSVSEDSGPALRLKDEFTLAAKYAFEHPTASNREIAKAVGKDEGTIRGWKKTIDWALAA